MNTRYISTPEIIASIRKINRAGEEVYYGDKIAGISVRRDGEDAVAAIDIRDLKGGSNLIVEIELHELVAALSRATLHSEKE